MFAFVSILLGGLFYAILFFGWQTEKSFSADKRSSEVVFFNIIPFKFVNWSLKDAEKW
jgi:hypothetical protein